MDWRPKTTLKKGPFYRDPRDPELRVVARDHAVPADMCRTASLRARALVEHLPSMAVIVDHAAVFVHTGVWTINPRIMRQVQTAPLPGRSTRWTSDRRLLKNGHIMYFAGVPVTTMIRTAADLLFLDDPDRGIPGVVALLRAGLNGHAVLDFMGDRYRGYPTDKISLMCEQLTATVGRDRALR